MSQKSGIFNFIKLPNLMVGLVAACACFTCGDAWGVKISGSVSGEYGGLDVEVLEYAHVCAIKGVGEDAKPKGCVLTDARGNFTIDINFNDGEKLIVSFVGCEAKTYTSTSAELGVDLGADGEWRVGAIELFLDCVNEIEEVTVNGCHEPRWVKRGRGNDAKCVEQECRGGDWRYVGKEWKCVDGEIIKAAPDAAPEEDDDNEYTDEPEFDNTDYESLAEEAREREQSMGNKLIGALGMGATGIGGSMLMSGLAESNADDDAERAMTAYLETFTCKYGNESVSGGTMNVEIPGGNELINMYSEYVALANDLKLRKAALGMKPGIESEPILDSATSGLYDDVGTGRGKGVYASLARALENPDGEDAKAWAAQREDAQKKTKTGAIVAGIGAVGSLIGNVAINADWGKNKHKALRDLEEDVNNIRPSRTPCPDDADGTYAPDCDCSGMDKAYNANMNRCDACPSGMFARNNSCVPQEANQTDVAGRGVDAGTAVGHDNGTGADDEPAVLSADAMFAYGKYELRPEAKGPLNEFIDRLRDEKLSDCKVNVVGYADRSGPDGPNEKLSLRRASKVAEYLEDNGGDVIKSAEPQGKGEEDCTCGLGSKFNGSDTSENGFEYCKGQSPNTPVKDELRYAPCRRVEVTLDCADEGNSFGADFSNLSNVAGKIVGGVAGGLATAGKGQLDLYGK